MGGLDFCGQSGTRLTAALCGQCPSCQLWAASALSDEELADEVSRRRSAREAEIEELTPDLLHGEEAAGYQRQKRSIGGPLTARCLRCERVFPSSRIARHVRSCRQRRQPSAKREPPKGPSPSLLPTDLGKSDRPAREAAPPVRARPSLQDALERFRRARGT
jgi:hypothetical protein